MLLCPVDLWRYVEFSALFAAYGNEQPVLDVGSPKAMSTLLCRQIEGRIHASDIAFSPLMEFRAMLARNELRTIAPIQGDGCRLPYGDRVFPFIYSISAIEHIGGEGDSQAVAEMARVLTPGGRIFLTVPLVPAYREQWVDTDPYGKQVRNDCGKVFFSRYYDWRALQNRVLAPSGLTVLSMFAWQERHAGWYESYAARTAIPSSVVSIAMKFLDPLWASARIESVPGGPSELSRHGVAAIVLGKPA